MKIIRSSKCSINTKKVHRHNRKEQAQFLPCLKAEVFLRKMMNQMTEAIPTVGDSYKHSTGIYTVDWVCGCGSYEDTETCVGLCGDGVTWTGSIKQMVEEGFIKT